MKQTSALYTLVLALAVFIASMPLQEAQSASGVRYDRQGRPFVVIRHGGKPVRLYCRKAFYGVVHCPKPRSRLRYGPYDRDFAVSQGYHITR